MRHAAGVTTPRRRAAARPAGPPDVQPAAPDQDRATAGPVDQHRRRQRAPRGSFAGTAERPAGDASTGATPPDAASIDPASSGAASPDDQAGVTAVSTATAALPPGAAAPQVPASPPAEREDRRRSEQRGDGRSEHRGDDRRRGESAIERSLRALVSTRTTQLPFDVAMRAREVAQPSAQDLADAERELVIVRRHYVPPAPLVTKKNDAGRGGRPDEAARTDGRGEARRSNRRSGRG